MDIKEIKAIDTMCRVFYCKGEAAQSMVGFYEGKVMAYTTFGGWMKKLGIKPGEEWKVLASVAKPSVEEMVAEMDEIGVEYVFLDQSVAWSRHEQRLWGTISIEEIAELRERSKGRVIGVAGYNPHQIEESLKEVERAIKDFGFKAVWAHPTSFGLNYADRKMYPLYTKCLELGIPVCMQTGQSAEPLPSEPGHPMYADEVAMDFPNLTIVLTHTGFPWVTEWISMLWRHPNVYGNIGAYMPNDLDPALVRFMDTRGRGKVMWATNGLGMTRCKKEFLELPIRDETRQMVLRDNALKVFKLE